MYLLLTILFWICLLSILHTYVFYPFVLKIFAGKKENNSVVYNELSDFPEVSFLMSLYNEQQVIEEKMLAVLDLNYPHEKLHFFIGSDCSSDQTNQIMARFAAENSNIHFYPFEERRGKPGVINEIAREAWEKIGKNTDHIFLLTDANVMPEKDCLLKMLRHFKNSEIALVDSNMIHTGQKASGISRSETGYISSEVHLKNLEGKLWQKMIGPFGGFYAIRSTHFSEVPKGYLVDDFYIAMRSFEKGGGAINELEARCYESVSHEISEEYKRKSRISAGNFQNLSTFSHLIWPPYKGLGFAFFSHKVLRWLTPFFLLGLILCCSLLAFSGSMFYGAFLLALAVFFLAIPLLDKAMALLNWNFYPFRTISYFTVMNLALLQGFFRYLRGVQSSIWEPTQRN